jgi:hypothetical protein
MSGTVKTWVNNSAPQCAAEDLNGFKNENNNLISSVGMSLNTADNSQTGKAVAAYAANGDFYVDSGTANAYVLTPLNNGGTGYYAPPTYSVGMRIRFFAANTNTNTSTVNPAGLGVKNIVLPDGTPLAGGEILANREVTLVYDGTKAVLINDGTLVKNESGTELFTADGEFVVPDGINTVWVTLAGGGGGGGGAAGGTCGSGGGGGDAKLAQKVTGLTAGDTIVVTVGQGGNPGTGASTPTSGTAGTASSFGSHVSASGGGAGGGAVVGGGGGVAGGPGGTGGGNGDTSNPGSGGGSIFAATTSSLRTGGRRVRGIITGWFWCRWSRC